MAESFAQRRNAVNRGLRQVRKAYRQADSQGEILERELDRLIDRKTIVSPESFQSMLRQYEGYSRAVRAMESTIQAAYTLSANYA